MFKRTQKAQFHVTIEGGTLVDGLRRFVPGDIISGEVSITPEEDINAEKVTVGIGWHTEGKGDRDEALFDQAIIYQGLMAAGAPLSTPYSFTVPKSPWSYAGKLITIVWAVVVTINPERGKDTTHEEPFVLRPAVTEAAAPEGSYWG